MKVQVNTVLRNLNEIYEDVRVLDWGSNRNVKLVKLKETRPCSTCGVSLPQGSTALTVNKRKFGRQWYCRRCQVPYAPREGSFLVGYRDDYESFYFDDTVTKWGTHFSEEDFSELEFSTLVEETRVRIADASNWDW